jgi:hypothetical protein
MNRLVDKVAFLPSATFANPMPILMAMVMLSDMT